MNSNATISMIERQDNGLQSDQFKRNRRVQIPGFLTDQSARLLYKFLAQQTQWNLAWNKGGQHTDMDFAAVQAWSAEQKRQLLEIIYGQAETGFQYFYAAIPIYDIYKKNSLPGHFLNQIYEFINDEKVLEFARSVTGFKKIKFADVQATRYSKGHFLSGHDDNVEGKGRLAAYVLNLTPVWNPDWGGALIFPDDEKAAAEAWFPRFNVLNIFAVPQRHAVTLVSPFAGANRYSITGWFRH